MKSETGREVIRVFDESSLFTEQAFAEGRAYTAWADLSGGGAPRPIIVRENSRMIYPKALAAITATANDVNSPDHLC